MHDTSARSGPEPKRPPAQRDAASDHRCPEPALVDAATLPLLQRAAGNAAVTALVQRRAADSRPVFVQRQTGTAVNHLAQLDEYLDAFDTPEERVIALLGELDDRERATVIAGYRGRLAGALDFSEMKRAVVQLRAPLPTQLEWLEAAAVATSAIAYGEIRSLVTAAPQSERDMLDNGRWRSFFTTVCDNTTIFTAVGDLGFDLATQLRWVAAEVDSLVSLQFSRLRPLLTAPSVTPESRATVAGEDWRPFWIDVCTNQTMAELVDVLFPGDLVRKLEWMAAEGSSLGLVNAKVAATTDAAQKLAVFGNTTIRGMMVDLCDDRQMNAFLLSLGGEWAQWVPWVRAEGGPLRSLAVDAVAAGRIIEPVLVGFVTGTRGSAADAREHVRALGDAQLAVLRAHPMPRDVITDHYGGDAGQVIRALEGEISAGEVTVRNDETLLAGPTTSPFVARDFGSDHRFDIAYHRDRVVVDSAVRLTPVDDRARELLPAAITTWQSRIQAAWDNKFQIRNGQRTIPMRFNAILGNSGSNEVNVHSGRWAWPNLNAGNWFAPDPVNVPDQAEAVSQAPVHEFGHLIGNLDEYNVGAAHYLSVVGQNPAADPDAVPETDTAGTTRYTNSLSVMGTGTAVLQRHVQNILDWVNGNLRSGEPSFSFV